MLESAVITTVKDLNNITGLISRDNFDQYVAMIAQSDPNTVSGLLPDFLIGTISSFSSSENQRIITSLISSLSVLKAIQDKARDEIEELQKQIKSMNFISSFKKMYDAEILTKDEKDLLNTILIDHNPKAGEEQLPRPSIKSQIEELSSLLTTEDGQPVNPPAWIQCFIATIFGLHQCASREMTGLLVVKLSKSKLGFTPEELIEPLYLGCQKLYKDFISAQDRYDALLREELEQLELEDPLEDTNVTPSSTESTSPLSMTNQKSSSAPPPDNFCEDALPPLENDCLSLKELVISNDEELKDCMNHLNAQVEILEKFSLCEWLSSENKQRSSLMPQATFDYFHIIIGNYLRKEKTPERLALSHDKDQREQWINKKLEELNQKEQQYNTAKNKLLKETTVLMTAATVMTATAVTAVVTVSLWQRFLNFANWIYGFFTINNDPNVPSSHWVGGDACGYPTRVTPTVAECNKEAAATPFAIPS